MAKTKITFFPSYRYKGVDPDVQVLKDHEPHSKKTRAQIAGDAGVTVGTLNKWFDGKTMKPANVRIEAVGRSMGIKRKWVRHDG